MEGRIRFTVRNLELKRDRSSSRGYVKTLRRVGIIIGNNISFNSNLGTISIDIKRPRLITIDEYVSFNGKFIHLIHAWRPVEQNRLPSLN